MPLTEALRGNSGTRTGDPTLDRQIRHYERAQAALDTLRHEGVSAVITVLDLEYQRLSPGPSFRIRRHDQLQEIGGIILPSYSGVPDKDVPALVYSGANLLFVLPPSTAVDARYTSDGTLREVSSHIYIGRRQASPDDWLLHSPRILGAIRAEQERRTTQSSE